jgi:aspartyl-tRNA(Asn)/glutamyl-tRNA(Gln) amidotransferase subunit B
MSRVTGANALSSEVAARYEPVIGLEVHLQLKTRTKVFCACSTRFGDPPNSNTCPVCLGLPGALPVLNRNAVELAIRAALALNCTIPERSRFARKNYFYPDLPKGYQISQYELPLAVNGWLEIELGGSRKRIGITRLHLEEDAGKNLHEGFPDSDRNSYIDYNRCGVPLIEIVSEPDIASPDEAYAYLTTLKQVLEYTGVSDCDMEKGSLRCDANVSVRLRGAAGFGTKTEVKNLNSFRYLRDALEHEIERQIAVLESGGRIAQETRLWNLAAGRTEPMRSKEYAHDYRYFPEPDLLPLYISEEWKARVRASMPELPAAKRARLLREYGIPPEEAEQTAAELRDAALSLYDVEVLTRTAALADYFENAVRALRTKSPSAAAESRKEQLSRAKRVANWIMTELLRRLNEAGREITDSPISPEALAELVALEMSGKITLAVAKKVFAAMFESGRSAADIVAAEGWAGQVSEAEIERAAADVIARNPENVAKYRAGNEGVFKFFVGQVMRATRGQANPQTVNEILRRLLRPESH